MCDNPAEVPDLTAVPPVPATAPLDFLEKAVAGVRQYHAVTTALDLQLFDLLKEPGTSDACARRLGCRLDLMALLCESLASAGLLEKDGGNFCASAVARTYLVSDSPFCQHRAIAFQRRLAGLWPGLSGILKTGPVSFDRSAIFRDAIIPSMADTCRCGLLQQVTGLVAAQPEFSRAKKLLDLGGGHGLYAIAFCQKNPSLEAVVFDLPPVTAATRDFIGRYRAARVSVCPGDFHSDPLGSGYDIVFSSSNPGGKVPALIPKIAAALNPGGLYINKQSVEEEGGDPFLDLEWNLWTFTGVRKQQKRYVFSDSVPFAEYNRQLARHGFIVREVVPVDDHSAMTVAQKVAGTG
jgi:hypothetical protein